MAYVVRRPHGRFEIRESLHTPGGPRARTLASFSVLTDAVLATAAGRALRPFDSGLVRASAARQGAPTTGPETAAVPPGTAAPPAEQYRRFAEAARRMARTLSPRPPGSGDPGEALIDLLGFAEQVVGSQPPRPFQPLAFPPLADLAARRQQDHEQDVVAPGS